MALFSNNILSLSAEGKNDIYLGERGKGREREGGRGEGERGREGGREGEGGRERKREGEGGRGRYICLKSNITQESMIKTKTARKGHCIVILIPLVNHGLVTDIKQYITNRPHPPLNPVRVIIVATEELHFLECVFSRRVSDK